MRSCTLKLAILLPAAAAASGMPTRVPINFWLLDGHHASASLSESIDLCRQCWESHQADDPDGMARHLDALHERPVAVELRADGNNARTFLLPRTGRPVHLNELTFGEAGLGSNVWDAGIALGIWLQENTHVVLGRSVLELGSGVGLAGISSALAGAASITLTDVDSNALLDNLAANAARNGVDATSAALDWAECGAAGYSPLERFSCILGSDLVYYDQAAALVHAVTKLLAPGGTCVLINVKGREGVEGFAQLLRESGQGIVLAEHELALVHNFGRTPLLLTTFEKHGAALAETSTSAAEPLADIGEIGEVGEIGDFGAVRSPATALGAAAVLRGGCRSLASRPATCLSAYMPSNRVERFLST